ncbi:Glu/Leu/Phe/Val family dehydrogenase [Pseudonocardia spinosispora]|uniref:Glu/Leu/Phe/Val family dehydrogenase n=1 Tax=Pseudonocardia spinosispora TaxID=103441 RepID=UPI00041AEE49|nr:Glu/Leu/Phe/Val dehydrogenase dimerization domain-containing protein [Pseudonocardia spinosispora]
MIFDGIEEHGVEQVVFGSDPTTGLRSLIVIHDTTLGPSLGGVRMWPYPSEAEAIADGLRLSRAMTVKAAAAGLNLGGSASLIIGDPGLDKTEELLRAHGRFIASLGGRFIPVNDVGTTQADMETIGLVAAPVCDRGDPSPYTALGVLCAIRAALEVTDLAGVTVAVQGVGNVGSRLVGLLRAESAEVIVADVVADRARGVARRHGARQVPVEEILGTPCDVLAPCALGEVVTRRTLPDLACRVIAGGANNVLAQPSLARELGDIRYVPDFIANAGGLIYLEEQLLGHDDDRATERVRKVGNVVADVLAMASDGRVTTVEAATELAHARLAARRVAGNGWWSPDRPVPTYSLDRRQ